MFIIYSKKNCSYCQKAKELLNNNNMYYDEKQLDPLLDKEFIEELKNTYNHFTFPFIFQNTNFIGGFTELNDFLILSEIDF